jgi:hypothetical protein
MTESIKICGEFIADATRSHVERDPRASVGARVLIELANALAGKPGQTCNITLDTEFSRLQDRL